MTLADTPGGLEMEMEILTDRTRYPSHGCRKHAWWLRFLWKAEHIGRPPFTAVAYRCGMTDVRTGEECNALLAPAMWQSVMEHFQTAHDLDTPRLAAAPRAFQTGLFDWKAHRRSALELGLCGLLPCGAMRRWWESDIRRGRPLFCVPDPAVHAESVAASANDLRARLEWRAGYSMVDNCIRDAYSVLCYDQSPVWVALACVVGGVTLCALPCGESLSPAPCAHCYVTRRQVINNSGIDETPRCSKLTVLLCPLCSQCQVWRELYFSGIWPGLTCSTATEADIAVLEPDAVWERYGLSESQRSTRAVGSSEVVPEAHRPTGLVVMV